MNPSIEILKNSFEGLGSQVIVFIPNLIIGLAFIGLGWLIGTSFEKILVYAGKRFKLDSFFDYPEVRSFLAHWHVRLDIGLFLGMLIKWFIFIAFLLSALQASGLSQVGDFLNQAISVYLPQVIIAIIILFFGMIGAKTAKNIIIGITGVLGSGASHFLGNFGSYAIWITTMILVLLKLGLNADLMRALFIGIIAGFSLAFGLAFGLGGKDVAAKILEHFYKNKNSG
ncbi:MAG: hypothetical protein WC878_03070 [Candidatus Paceibacterota bacterium]|jgi:hypothetical protein